jgi:beta-galactosidase
MNGKVTNSRISLFRNKYSTRVYRRCCWLVNGAAFYFTVKIAMNASILMPAAVVLTVITAVLPAGADKFTSINSHRVEINFNSGWLYSSADVASGQSTALNDSSFEAVCLPHTNKIVKHADFDTASFAFVSWYRRHFKPPQEYKGRRFVIEFQGVSKAAEVFVNGKQIGEHKGAYTPFSFDMTDKVRTGSDNVIAVRVDSRQRKDIPPEWMNVDYMIFGGIVRNVTVRVLDPLHVEWVYVSQDSIRTDCVAVKTRVVNDNAVQKNFTVTTVIVDAMASIVAKAVSSHTIAANSSREFTCETGPIAHPVFWHPDRPCLYTVHTLLKDSVGYADEHRQKFGIRSVSFSKTDGAFSINGEKLKLRGLNRHETFPFVGRAAADRLQRKDADIIKYELGCNIVRCSHYPQSPAFLDRCDEIGLLVLEEIPGWMFVSKRSEWRNILLKNVEEMVVRDRNHPSIISFGVRVNQSADFHDLYVKTNRLARELDPTRPTHGVRVLGHGSFREFLEDVWTYNYSVPAGTPRILPWLTTECVGHYVTTRSWDNEQHLVDQMLAHAAVHDSAAANPKVAGLLGWCAFDYNSPYSYAEKKVCYHGVADIFRIPKHAAWFYRSQADPALYGPIVYIAHYWQKALEPNNVYVASNCAKVELFVNNRSKGLRFPKRFRSLPHPLFVWNALPFKAGELKAVGYIGDSAVAVSVRRTPGAPVRLTMTPDDTVLVQGGDMTRVVITAVDAFGQVVPRTSSMVTVSVSGQGDFLGESPVVLEDGKSAFFVKTRADQTGEITCLARCPTMAEATAGIAVISE